MLINFEKLKNKLVEERERAQLFFFGALAIFGSSFATGVAVKTGWPGFTTPLVVILGVTLTIMFFYLIGFSSQEADGRLRRQDGAVAHISRRQA